jgi:hypothetical protein
MKMIVFKTSSYGCRQDKPPCKGAFRSENKGKWWVRVESLSSFIRLCKEINGEIVINVMGKVTTLEIVDDCRD